MMLVNRHWGCTLGREEAIWKVLCDALQAEHFVYVPPVCTRVVWRDVFLAFWPMRERWEQSVLEEQCATSKVCTTVAEFMKRTKAGEQDLELNAGVQERRRDYTFGVSVCARFRPVPTKAKREAAGAEHDAKDIEAVSLPLHQRLALIRTRSGCSEAEGKAQLFGSRHDPFGDAFIPETEAEKASMAELTPQKQRSARHQEESIVAAAEAQQGIVAIEPTKVTMCAAGVGLRDFTCFDSVLHKDASQGIVYEAAGREQVSQFLNGVNATVLCYGQTGSGKTYTLLGPNAETASSLTLSPGSGILPRVCHEV